MILLLRPSPSLHLSRRHCPGRASAHRKINRPTAACVAHGDESSRLLEAAKIAINDNVRSGMVIGLGSGLASSLAIQYIGRQLNVGNLKNIVGIPMSVSSATEAAKVGIPLKQYEDSLQIDFAFDDADAIEEGSLAAIIGRRRLDGGESILQEKCIITQAEHLAFIVNERRYSKNLRGAVPVVIQSGNWMGIAEEIDDLFLGDAEVWRRSVLGSAGPTGGDFPLVTKEGHHVLDVIFTSPILDISHIVESLERIDGVVEHGIVVGIPDQLTVVPRHRTSSFGLISASLSIFISKIPTKLGI